MKPQAFDFLVFIGRFQPLHDGHCKVVETALAHASHVIVLIGSAHEPRSIRNPWTYQERERWLRDTFAEAGDRLLIAPLLDELYNEQGWLARVQQTVQGLVARFPPKVGSAAPRIGLIGHSKDHSSYYLSMFPQWGALAAENVREISATPLREQYFLREADPRDVPPVVREWLAGFRQTDTWRELAEEWRFINQYRQGWASAPYPPTFVTVDALVVQAGHVLLVERKARPGKGLWALPGGFVGADETLRAAMVRELREETRIKVPAPVLLGAVVKTQVFDAPHRSARGRTLTHVFHLELRADASGLPKVKGGDDAQHAFWVPLGDLQPTQLFEDHFHIIKALIG